MSVDELLIGREAELAEAWAALERGGCITLKGAPGVGKSTLSRRLIRRLRARGSHVVSVLCSEPMSRLEVLTSLSAAVGVEAHSSDARLLLHTLARHLDALASVVVIDGPFAGSQLVAEVVDELLLDTEHVRVTVCSWRALELALEQVIHVEPLTHEATLALLAARTSALSSQQLDSLAAASGGVPLVIELLAARVSTLGMQAEQHPLRSERLDASIAATVALLRREDAEALGALSVFRGVFPVELASVIVTPESLERLCAASLVHVHEPGWLRLLDTVRDFAERNTASDVLDDARDRHCASLAKSHPVRADDSATFTKRGELRSELLRAWNWAYSKKSVDMSLQLARTLDPVLVTQGPGALHRDVLVRTLALGGGDAVLRVDLLLSVARLDAIRGHHRSAVQWVTQAKREAEALGDVSRQGWACAIECYSLRPLGAYDEAKTAGLRALSLAREVRELSLTGMAEQALGTLAAVTGNPDEAARGYQRAAAAARVAKAPRLLGIAYGNLGSLYLTLSHPDAARTLEEARAAFEAAGDRFHLARLSVDEAALAVQRDEPKAERLVAASIDAVCAAGAVDGELRAREVSVLLAQRRGDGALVSRRLDELAALAAQTDDVSWPSRIERLRSLPVQRRVRSVLSASRDARRVELDGRSLDFSRRGPLRRVLLALLEAENASLSAAQVQEAGWPGEKMFPESASARVYVTIRRLRELGLESVLLTRDDGYVLSSELEVRWL